MTLIEKPFVVTERPDIIVMEGASWELYELMVRDRDAAGQHFQITYDNGRMVIMSPLPIHDLIKGFLRRMVESLDWELDLGVTSYGSTTWRREDSAVGLEPDECFYIGSVPDFDPTKLVDLAVYPAPDLAIEVNITHHLANRLALYAGLGVKEVWRYTGQRVEIWTLRADAGKYDRIGQSTLLPHMTEEVLNRFVAMLSSAEPRDALRAFQSWIGTLPRT